MLNRLSLVVTGLFSVLIAISTLSTKAAAAIQQIPGRDTVIHLDELLQEALSNNQNLEAKKLHAFAEQEGPAQVSSLPSPVIGVGYQPAPIYTARGFQRFQFQVEQRIPFPGTLGLSKEIAEYTASIAKYDVGIEARLLVYQVTVSYVEIFRVQQQLALIDEFRLQLSDLVTSTTARYKVGNGTQQDILKAQLERNQLDRIAEELFRLKSTEAELLAGLIGRSDGISLLSHRFDVDANRLGRGERLADSLKMTERPEILVQKTKIQRSAKSVELAEKMFWPDFSASFHYYDIGASDLTPTMTGQNAWGLQLKMSVPLWRGALKARENRSRIEQRERSAELQDLQVRIATQINAARSQLHSEERTLGLYDKTLIPQSETVVEASLNAYSSDQADFLDLLDAERTLFNLQSAYIDTASRRGKFEASLDWAEGIVAPGYEAWTLNLKPQN